QIINGGVDFGEVDVDVVVLHLIRRRLPVHAQYAPYAIRLQRLDQALALGVVGDGRVVAGIGGIDDGRYDLRVAARGGPGKIPKLHGVEIIKDLVRAGPDWLEIEFLFFFFDRKVEISLENLCRFFQSCAEPAELGADGSANRRRVLANPGREYDCIEPAEYGRVGTDELDD